MEKEAFINYKNIINKLKCKKAIKKENKKWEPSKEQLNKIIKFLNEQTKTIPNGDFVMLNKLNWYKEDFQKLLIQREHESDKIKEDSKKSTKIIRNELKNGEDNYKWNDLYKTKIKTKSPLEFSDTKKTSFESKLDLNEFTNHTVKSGDLLWNIVKNHYKSLNLSRMELIHAINYIVDINVEKYPHIIWDNKLAKWIRWSDGIRWDNIRIGDVLRLPNIKKVETKTKKVDNEKVKTKTKKVDNEKVKPNTYTEHFIFKDGRVLLVWKDWEKSEYSKELSKEEIETIKKFKKVAILNEVLEIWKTEANNIVDSLYWKSARTDDDKILEEISWVENDFATLFSLIQNNKVSDQEINKYIDTIFNKIWIAEDQESIIWSDDMIEVKDVLLSDLDKNKKLIKIFNLMRYKGLSWNSATVKEKVSNHLLTQKEFKSTAEILNNKNLLPFIENNKKEELSKLIGNEDLAEKIIESYNKIKVKQEQHRDDYSKKLLVNINNDRVQKWEPKISLDAFIKLKVNYSIQTLVKHKLIESKIDSMVDRWDENKTYTWIYANLSGLWKSSSSDILVIADDNIDTAIDIWTTLAISAVSMWVWALAARWAMMAVNAWSKALKIWQASTRIWWISRWAWTSVIEWTSFYMWTNTMNNLIYWNFEGNNFWENNLNWKEILKSIAFMWVLRWASKIMEEAEISKVIYDSWAWLNMWIEWKTLATLWNLKAIVPPLMLKQTSITWILAEAGILTGTSVGLEVIFEWEWEFTMEEYLQSLAMVALFRGAWKIKFWKNKEWKIEAEVTKSKTETKQEEVKPEKETNENTISTENLIQKKQKLNIEEKNIQLNIKNTLLNNISRLKDNIKRIKSNWQKSEDFKNKKIWDLKALIELNQEKLEKVIKKIKQLEKIQPQYKWSTEAPINKKAKNWKKEQEQSKETKTEEVKTEEVKTEESENKKDNSKKEQNKNTNSEEIIKEYNLTRYEVKRFKNLFLNKLKDKNKITLENQAWEKLVIVKQSNGKFTIDWKWKPLNEKEMFSKIDNSFKVELINKTNYEHILKISEGEEFNLNKTLWHPINWKIQIKKDWEVFLNWKKLKPERVKQLLKIPKIRESILKQKLDNMKPEELSEKLSNLKWWEKFKWLSSWTKQIVAERIWALINSWFLWWISWVILHELFTDRDQWSSTSERLLDLAMAFAGWALWWIAISWLKWASIITYKASKWTIKWVWNNAVIPVSQFISQRFIPIVWVWTVWVITYNLVKD